MATGLMQKTEMPNFSILGMLLGGRGYASNWFGTRDQLELQANERSREAANRQSSVNTLIGGPEYAAFKQDPYSMEALTGIWGRGNQADIDPTTGKTITNLFETGLANVYGRQSQQYAQKLNQENQLFGQKIAQENVLFSNEQDKKLAQEKREQENAALQAQWKQAFGDNPQVMTALLQGKLLKDSGIDMPGETMPTTINGAVVGVPIPGGKLYNDTIQPVLAQSQLNQMIDTVVGGFDKGTILNQGQLDSLRTQISEAYRIANKAGTMDEGLKNLLADLFPSNLDFYADPRKMGQYQEKWRTAKLVNDAKLADMKKYTVLPFDVNASPLGGPRPDAAAAAAKLKQQQESNQQQIQGPQTNPRFGAPAASGGQTGRGARSGGGGRGAGTFWETPAGAKTRTGGTY